MRSPTHYVYLLRCGNGTIYVGQTHDIEVRMGRHRNGTGARHTAQNKPFEVIYTEGPMSLEEAIARERQLKKWSLALEACPLTVATPSVRRSLDLLYNLKETLTLPRLTNYAAQFG